MIPPFCYRPLAPLLASCLPLPSLAAINVLNILCLATSLLLLDRIFRVTRVNARGATIGMLLFVLSFPVFYYGTIGFIDPVAVLVVTAAVYWSLRRRWALLGVTLVLGVAVKETNAFIALAPLLYAWSRRECHRHLAWQTVFFVSLAAGTALVIRLSFPFPNQGFFWIPRLQSVFENLARIRTYLSLGLTIGPHLAVAAIGAIRNRPRLVRWDSNDRFFLAGTSMVFALYTYSIFTAYTDGRIIWVAYPFLIPFAVRQFQALSSHGFGRTNANPCLPGLRVDGTSLPRA